MNAGRVIPLCMAVVSLAAISGCTGGKTERAYAAIGGGNPEAGERLIVENKCGSCHTIPGVRSARGKVGPPLNFFGQRSFVAGRVPNSFENVTQWVHDPKSIDPETAMPNLGLTEEEAKDVAAYLYTLY